MSAVFGLPALEGLAGAGGHVLGQRIGAAVSRGGVAGHIRRAFFGDKFDGVHFAGRRQMDRHIAGQGFI